MLWSPGLNESWLQSSGKRHKTALVHICIHSWWLCKCWWKLGNRVASSISPSLAHGQVVEMERGSCLAIAWFSGLHVLWF